MQALYGAADLFVVGQFADSAAVSAVAIGSQVMQTITLMHTPMEAVKYTKEYIIICTLGIPFIIGYNAVSAIFRGLGDSKTPVYFVLIACIINIVVDIVLVGVFKLGAIGAAIATVSEQGLSFIIALFYIIKKGFTFKITREDFRLDKESVILILKVGFPLALQDALVNVSFLIITAVINTMGLVASAAVGVVEEIIVFAMLPPTSFGAAVSAMTAQNIGAGETARAKKVLRYGITYSLIFDVISMIYSMSYPETITSLFSNDTEVIKVSSQYLMSYSIDCVMVSFVFCINGYLSGLGKSTISLIHSLIATFGFRIPLTLLISKISGVTLFELGFAAPISSLVSIIICVCYLTWKGRQENKLNLIK